MNSVHIQTNWKSTVSHIILGNKNLATYWLFFYNILSVLGWFQAFFSFSSLFWSMLPVYMNWGDQEASTGNKSYCVKADQDRKTAPPTVSDKASLESGVHFLYLKKFPVWIEHKEGPRVVNHFSLFQFLAVQLWELVWRLWPRSKVQRSNTCVYLWRESERQLSSHISPWNHLTHKNELSSED